MLRVRRYLEAFSELTGTVIGWFTLTMVLGTFAIVVLRYAFDLGWIAMQESITWMHAAVFMLGAAYTLKRDEHVRVDIFYRGMSDRNRAIVDLAGTVAFLLPMAVFLAVSSWDYVYASWAINEASREAGGLPYPFVPILKSLIPTTAVMLIAQGVANALGSILILTGQLIPAHDREVPQGEVI